MPSSNNKRIAKNTLFLYMRMLVLMAITLYTSRVVLQQLGVSDFGVYNVVGGVVAMLSFFNTSMSTATQRFIAYALGKKDVKLENDTFAMAVIIHVMIAAGLVILAETIGLWIFHKYLVIPPESRSAAIFVYHFSVLTAIAGILVVPFLALVTAHENMQIYAYFSIIEGLTKLGVAFALIFIATEKLKLYAILVFLAALTVDCMWIVYCRLKFPTCKIKIFWDKGLFRGIVSFVGWQTVATFGAMLKTQGVNIVLNSFFGPLLNAARGIAVQVNSALMGFVGNFQVATNPQLTKYYAQADMGNMRRLTIQSSKMCFMLMLLVSAPILMETEPILKLWLGEVPKYSVLFVRLCLIANLANFMSSNIDYAALASGRIKWYQLICSIINACNLPIVYVAYRLGAPAMAMYLIEIALSVITLVVRLLFIRQIIALPVRVYCTKVLLRDMLTCCAVFAPCILIQQWIGTGLTGTLLMLGLTVGITVLFIFTLGFNSGERKWVLELTVKKFHRK